MMIGEEVIAYYGDAGDGAELFEIQKLVRCKDCKHYFSGNWCEILKAESMVENGFCAYGERKDNE